MSSCTHELHERETACADGMCPLCSAAERDALAARVAALEAALLDATEHLALAVKVAEERDGREHYFDRKVIAEWRALAAPESA